MELKEQIVSKQLSEWGVTVEDFVALCETHLKKCNDARAERILGHLLEYSNFTEFAEAMEKRNIDQQVRRCSVCGAVACTHSCAHRVRFLYSAAVGLPQRWSGDMPGGRR